eukprot:TRINITY_DN2711_c0_g1_i4.p1 TRINITY_DN2711_c0_g1~~TRINITY_DN2711_c0_g1_i4.p1  ORF type:complete len:791 (+),score=210.28 TRINITY_DN2711_c0_g1_i4:18-2390(+)
MLRRAVSSARVLARPPYYSSLQDALPCVGRFSLLTRSACLATVARNTNRHTQANVSSVTFTPATRLLRPCISLLHTSSFNRTEATSTTSNTIPGDLFSESGDLSPNPSSGRMLGSSLIPVVNKLQEVCSLVGAEIHLPQIVVIGSQSSGKSSVLENLVGKDFLPRGSGLVTRRPLILQLTQIADSDEEWGEFAHKQGEKFTYDQLRDEIMAETDRTTGKNKGISSEPIILKIFSRHVLPLTLVDTPGLARVPIGDQPADIEDQIRRMIVSYISNPNSIILAVSPANADLVTSDALKLAREVDPSGSRTVGVLTKLDLMDKGTDALEVLLGKVFPLQLGYVGIVNRSQQDINQNKPVSKALEDEAAWFEGHPVYQSIANHSGTSYLANKCSKLLTKHIRDCLPDVKNQIRDMIKKTQKELELYGRPVGDSRSDQGSLLMSLLTSFAQKFQADIEGKQDDVGTNQITGGARIRYIFSNTLPQNFKALSPTDGLSDHQIRIVLRNAAGSRPALFVPDQAFELLMRRQIEKMKDPALRAAELVLEELVRISSIVEGKTLARFPVLRDRVVEVATHVLRKCLKPTNEMIAALVECEAAYINTAHPSFAGHTFLQNNAGMLGAEERQEAESRARELAEKEESAASSGGGFFGRIFGGGGRRDTSQSSSSSSSYDRRSGSSDPPSVLHIQEELTDTERAQIRLLKQLLASYQDIAQKNVRDNTIKAIMHLLVNKSVINLQRDLVTGIYKEEQFSELLREADGVVARRQAAVHRLDVLKRAKKVLQFAEMRDMPLSYY